MSAPSHGDVIKVRMLAALAAVSGSTVGLLGALGWRYATRRLVVIDNPPPTTPGSKGFMFTFDTLNVVAEPQWWPGLLVLPVTGAVVAIVVAMISRLALTSIRSPRAIWLTLAVTAVTTGAGVALATILLTDRNRPAVLVQIVNETSSARPNTTPLTDGDWDREWSPIGVWFPVIGIAGALLITAVTYVGYRILAQRITRGRNG